MKKAIVEPARQNGWLIQEGLDEQILDDVGDEPGVLPFLSHALRETWECRRANVLTLQRYRDVGGVKGAIATTAEDVWHLLGDVKKEVTRKIFLELTELGEIDSDGIRTPDTRRRMARSSLRSESVPETVFDEVLNTLVRRRLIRVDGEYVEVAHEVIIRAWDRLQEWLLDKRGDLQTHRRLTQVAITWDKNKRDKSDLLSGRRLTKIEQWLQEQKVTLSGLEQEYVRQSSLERQRGKRRIALLASLFVLVVIISLVSIILLQANANTEIQAGAENARNAEATTEFALNQSEERGTAVAEQSAAAQAAEATAITEAQIANHQRRITLIQSLTGFASSILDTNNDTELATLLILEASRLNQEENAHLEWLLYDAFQQVNGNYFNNIIQLPGVTIYEFAFSPNSEWLATLDSEDAVYLWNLAGNLSIPDQTLAGFEGYGQIVTFSPDQKWLAAANEKGIIYLWDLQNPTLSPQVLTDHFEEENENNYVEALTFSPDGKLLVSGDWDGKVRLWDMDDLQSSSEILFRVGEIINSLAFSPDGKWLAIAAGNHYVIEPGSVIVQNMQDLTESPVILRGHIEVVREVVFSPRGDLLVSISGDETFRLWSVDDFDEVYSQANVHPIAVNSAGFSPDGRWLATSGGERSIRLWSVDDLSAAPIVLSGQGSTVYEIAFSPDGKWLAADDNDGVRLWRLNNFVAPSFTANNHWIHSVAFSPDGKFIASGGSDGILRVWLPQNLGESLIFSVNHNSEIIAIDFSPDSRWVAFGSEDGSVEVWSLDNHKELVNLQSLYSSAGAIAFSPDGRWLVTAGDNEGRGSGFDANNQSHNLMVWNTQNWDLEYSFTGDIVNVKTVAFSPDGKWLASSGVGRVIYLWDTANLESDPVTFNEFDFSSGSFEWVSSLTFSLDSKWLIAGNWNQTVQIWSLENTSQEALIIDDLLSPVNTVALSPDGQFLAIGSGDLVISDYGRIGLWQLSNPNNEPVILESGTTAYLTLAFSPDGKWLVSGDDNGRIKYWPLLEVQLEVACQQLVRRNLSMDEWSKYVPGEPYHQTCPNLPPADISSLPPG